MNHLISIKKYLLLCVTLFSFVIAEAQYMRPVRDPGLNGQLKRMVDQQWNDWQPDPRWRRILGVPVWPRDAVGSLMWGVVNRRYWKGHDRRPYRAGGQFQQNLATLTIQKERAERAADSAEAVSKQEMGTYLNSMGGAGDVAYVLYFRKKFSGLFNDFKKPFEEVLKYRPKAYEEMKTKPQFRALQENYEIQQDRIKTIHESFMEKGARIEGYFKILDDVHTLVESATEFCAIYISIDKKALLAEKIKKYQLENKDTVPTNDKAIVQKILTKYNF